MSSPQYAARAMGGPQVQKLTWSHVLHRAYTLYAKNFWTYFRIALLPMAVTYLFNYASRLIFRQLLAGNQFFPGHPVRFYLVIGLNGWINGAAYWIISAFFCAAIAATFEREQTGGLAIADAYTLPRRRLGAVTAVALLAWTVFFAGRLPLVMTVMFLLGRLGISNNYWVVSSSIGVVMLALAGLIARFGLAIPALMHDPKISIREALRTSVQRTENWEKFFMLFLAKAAVAGYIVYWFVQQGMYWAWQHAFVSATAYVWIEWALYICLAAALESPLFIAFSVLYQELPEKPQGAADRPPLPVS